MARDQAPVAPRESVQIANPRTGLATEPGLEILRQLWRQICAGFVIVPCSASGKNTVTLTPRLHEEGASNLGDGMGFIYEAEQTSDGDMSITFGAIGTFNLYKANGATRATTGDHVDGSVYRVHYWDSLNAGAGGFVIL